MERYEDPGTMGDLEGAGPGGGTNLVRQHRAGRPPGSRVPLAITLLLVILILAVPVVWAIGVYARWTVVPGLNPTIEAAYLVVAVVLLVSAALYFWGQYGESA